MTAVVLTTPGGVYPTGLSTEAGPSLATAYGNNFGGAGANLLPAVTPGTPIAAFNVTATESGIFEILGSLYLQFIGPTFGGPQVPSYTINVYTGSSTGGFAPAGEDTLYASVANPIVVPAGASSLVQLYQVNPLAETSDPISLPVSALAAGLPIGTAMSIVIFAISQSGGVSWTYNANLAALERALS